MFAVKVASDYKFVPQGAEEGLIVGFLKIEPRRTVDCGNGEGVREGCDFD